MSKKEVNGNLVYDTFITVKVTNNQIIRNLKYTTYYNDGTDFSDEQFNQVKSSFSNSAYENLSIKKQNGKIIVAYTTTQKIPEGEVPNIEEIKELYSQEGFEIK